MLTLWQTVLMCYVPKSNRGEHNMIKITDNRVEIGQRLLAWREALNLTQMQLARRMGWRNHTKISNWEKGDRFANIHDMMAMEEKMPIAIEWVYKGCEDRMPTALMQKIRGGKAEENGPFSQTQ